MRRTTFVLIAAAAAITLSACEDVTAGSHSFDTVAPGGVEADVTLPLITEAPDNGLSPSQDGAVRKAESYLDMAGFSRGSLIDQLEFEQFSTADATFAADFLNVNWNSEAAEKAQSYVDMTGFSCQGLIEQLTFEKFTAAEAQYGATSVGLC